MMLLELLASRPFSRSYEHLRPRGANTANFDPATSSAEAYMLGLSADGLTLADLLGAARELYAWRFPRWRGLGDGFAKAKDVPPWDGLFALWTLAVLGSGAWPMLELYDADPVALLQELLAGWPPRIWMDQADLLRLPQKVREILRDDRVEVGPVGRVDLRWLPRRMACGLTLRGPITEALLPTHLRCRGPILIDGVGGIEQVRGLEAPGHEMRITGLPDLRRVHLPAGTKMIVEGCSGLHTVEGEIDRALVLRNLPTLEVLAIRAPDLAGRAADLTLENCPRLARLQWPSGPYRWVRNLTLVDCPRLEAIPQHLRVVGERHITGCPEHPMSPTDSEALGGKP